MIYLNKTCLKAVDLTAVKAFDFYPQHIPNQFGDRKVVDTLRVILSGGDQWWEGAEAVELYQILLKRVNPPPFLETLGG